MKVNDSYKYQEKALLIKLISFSLDVEKTKNLSFQEGIKFGHLSYFAQEYMRYKRSERSGIDKLSLGQKQIVDQCEQFVKDLSLDFFSLEYIEENFLQILKEAEEEYIKNK